MVNTSDSSPRAAASSSFSAGSSDAESLRASSRLAVTVRTASSATSATTPPSERDAGDRRGVLAWTFDAPAGELREIKLAWRVRWP